MNWLLVYVIGVCVVYSMLHPWNILPDKEDFFAAFLYDGLYDRIIIAGKAVFWPLWLIWVTSSVLLGWLTWLTGFDGVNRQRIYEKIAIVVLISYLIVSQLWEGEDDALWRWGELLR
jgi:hypothetical protein